MEFPVIYQVQYIYLIKTGGCNWQDNSKDDDSSLHINSVNYDTSSSQKCSDEYKLMKYKEKLDFEHIKFLFSKYLYTFDFTLYGINGMKQVLINTCADFLNICYLKLNPHMFKCFNKFHFLDIVLILSQILAMDDGFID